MQPSHKRVFQLHKKGNALSFFQSVYSKHDPTTDYYTKKQDSTPVTVDEKLLTEKMNNSSTNNELLFPGTIWSSIDKKSFLISAPAGIKKIKIDHLNNNFLIYHPKLIYAVYMADNHTPYISGIWYDFNISNEITVSDRVYPAFLPNVFYSGLICVHNVYSKLNTNNMGFNISINTAIEEFWNGNFNNEVTDIQKGIKQISTILINDFGGDYDINCEFNFYAAIHKLVKKNNFQMIETLYDTLRYHSSYQSIALIIKNIVRHSPQMAIQSGNSNKQNNDYAIALLVRNIHSSIKNI